MIITIIFTCFDTDWNEYLLIQKGHQITTFYLYVPSPYFSKDSFIHQFSKIVVILMNATISRKTISKAYCNWLRLEDWLTCDWIGQKWLQKKTVFDVKLMVCSAVDLTCFKQELQKSIRWYHLKDQTMTWVWILNFCN